MAAKKENKNPTQVTKKKFKRQWLDINLNKLGRSN